MATSAENPPPPVNGHSAAVKIAESLAKLRLAHEAAMTQDAQAMLAIDRERLKAHQREFLGDRFHEPGNEMIHIGDVHQAAPPVARSSAPVSGALAKLALGVGLIATGAGIPAGAWLVADALKSRPPETAVPEGPTTPAERPQESPVMPDVPNWRLEVVPPEAAHPNSVERFQRVAGGS